MLPGFYPLSFTLLNFAFRYLNFDLLFRRARG